MCIDKLQAAGRIVISTSRCAELNFNSTSVWETIIKLTEYAWLVKIMLFKSMSDGDLCRILHCGKWVANPCDIHPKYCIAMRKVEAVPDFILWILRRFIYMINMMYHKSRTSDLLCPLVSMLWWQQNTIRSVTISAQNIPRCNLCRWVSARKA